MAQAADSSASGRSRQGTRPIHVGLETGLPLVMCPICKKARVIERRSRKENENIGRVFFKCPRDNARVGSTCYYRFQRQYLEDLVEQKYAEFYYVDPVDEEEVQSTIPTTGAEEAPKPGGLSPDLELEARMEKLTRVVRLLLLLVVGLGGLFVGFVMK